MNDDHLEGFSTKKRKKVLTDLLRHKEDEMKHCVGIEELILVTFWQTGDSLSCCTGEHFIMRYQVDSSLASPPSHSAVRVSVYRTLELWVQVAGASSNILQGSPGHSELLFNHLLGDITPGAESIKVGESCIWTSRRY